MAYLIGSKALEFWGLGEFPNSDYDIVCKPEEFDFWKKQFSKVECHDIDDLNNREICEKYSFPHKARSGKIFNVVERSGLAAIKRSHLYRDYKWDRHIAMYHKVLKPYMTDESYKLAMDRKKLTIAKFGKRNPSLLQKNEDFFDDAIEKKYDHDMLHELVAYYNKPLYTRLKYEDKTDLAWCEKDLWKQLSYEDQVKCAAEETYVIAAERFLIPQDWKGSKKKAWFLASKKLCTTLTSGWFRDFAIDNYEEVYNMFNEDKFKELQQKLEGL